MSDGTQNPLTYISNVSTGTKANVDDSTNSAPIPTPRATLGTILRGIFLIFFVLFSLIFWIIRLTIGDENSNNSALSQTVVCSPAPFYKDALQETCGAQMNVVAPNNFSIIFYTSLGPFTADCVRDRAPVQVDRLYNLALNGYYDDNYFFRVLHNDHLNISQFGTNGDPDVSNVYNFMSLDLGDCAVILPQPPYMTINVGGTQGLSNTYGTISMSTSYNESLGKTWNATAELFINTGNNSQLDGMLFIPLCTVSDDDMENVVMNFPSFGEVTELGGDGVSLDELYTQGNKYIENNPDWNDMTKTNVVRITCLTNKNKSSYKTNVTCGPCMSNTGIRSISMPYKNFVDDSWQCPAYFVDTCI